MNAYFLIEFVFYSGLFLAVAAALSPLFWTSFPQFNKLEEKLTEFREYDVEIEPATKVAEIVSSDVTRIILVHFLYPEARKIVHDISSNYMQSLMVIIVIFSLTWIIFAALGEDPKLSWLTVKAVIGASEYVAVWLTLSKLNWIYSEVREAFEKMDIT